MFSSFSRNPCPGGIFFKWMFNLFFVCHRLCSFLVFLQWYLSVHWYFESCFVVTFIFTKNIGLQAIHLKCSDLFNLEKIKNGNPEVLSMDKREISLSQPSCSRKWSSRFRQSLFRHEWDRSQLFTPKWWSQFPIIWRKNVWGNVAAIDSSYRNQLQSMLHTKLWCTLCMRVQLLKT